MENLEKLKEIGKFISANKERFINILIKVMNYTSANYEVEKSIDCLMNIQDQKEYLIGEKVELVTTYLLSNLPLYSLVLYAIVPSLISEKVIVKPSSLSKEMVIQIFNIIREKFDINISIFEGSYNHLWNDYASKSKVIIFTGSYENSIKLEKKVMKNQLFIYSGGGICPFIIGKNADIKEAINSLIKSRIFNSGQDCMAPNLIFIHKSILDKSLNMLKNKLTNLKVGSYPDADIGPILNKETLEKAYENIKGKEIIFGGEIDFQRNIVPPTIIITDIKEYEPKEYFCPIFNICLFESFSEIKDFFQSEKYKHYAMVATVFGDEKITNLLMNDHMVAKNISIFNIEDGNKAFGGYGRFVNHIRYCNKIENKPILISKEIRSYLQGREKIKIRRASLDDLQGIIKLQADLMEGFKEFDEEYYEKNERASEIWGKYIKKKFGSDKSIIFVAERDCEIIGYILGYIKSTAPVYKLENIGYISDIYVKKEFRRMKIASQLFNQLMNWFKEKKIEYSEAIVDSRNIKIITFFEKMNFKKFNKVMQKKL